jgi:peptidoglycan/LPS O-acetylase OafA/YrhL
MAPWLRTIYDFRGYGGFGVDVFFVLSGFLISSLLIADRKSPTFFKDFYWKRALRILPVYFIHLAVTVLLYQNTRGYVLLCLVFLVNFANPLHVKAPGQGWTLSIEEQFYVLWPQAIRRMRAASLYALAMGLVVSANVLRVLMPLLHGGASERLTFYRTDGLALGALIAFERFLPLEEHRGARWIVGFLRSNWTLAGVFAIVFLVRAHGSSLMIRQVTLTAANLLFYRMIRLIVFHRGKGLGWLGSRGLVYLGGISYGLYMYQGFVITISERMFGLIPGSHGGAIVVRGLLVLLACFAVCTVSRYAIELPAQKLRRLVLGRREVPEIEVQAEPLLAPSS